MTDDTRRHWHGTSGDRHEHLNAWVAGGAKGPAGRAPWALTPEMMKNLNNRRDSSGSASSSNAGAETNTSNSPPTVSERRRSSASGAGLFSNLQSQKRDSGGSDMAGRRASWNEQAAKGGVFSKLWDGYTKGN
ncbi:uncharacterized protein N7469_008889 [Penicillium citrinum]|uniref:Uncharacterized protein n=2 Tax=Penicillium TaxID=5073 RepID=A0A9W9THH7_PENCI|nr:uncharacterized protein N7469_008889 [Penicillium citrinum]KAJ5222649.1 hypothetical protein N7469_008889 [Penicillium citrinum]KAK5788584.1 hypothetical protein VI817_009542 [Penicillium citrinum]